MDTGSYSSTTLELYAKYRSRKARKSFLPSWLLTYSLMIPLIALALNTIQLHYTKRVELEDRIDVVEKMLIRYFSDTDGSDEAKIAQIHKELLAPTSEWLYKIPSMSDGSKKPAPVILKIINRSPKPSLHLSASKLYTRPDKENLERLETVTGWEIADGGESGSDPYKNGSDIVIARSGMYTVYSQMVVHCQPSGRPTVRRHLVQYIEVLGEARHPPRPLMENAYQMCGKHDKTRISYQSGIFRFNANDILRVVVKKEKDIVEHDDVNNASFGVFSL